MSTPIDLNDPRAVAHYDELPLWSSMAGLLLLDHVPVTAHWMLDVACGTGFPLLELAERLGPSARAVGVDLWDPALRRARDKTRSWSVEHAALTRANAAALPFRDGVFDLVTSNLGLNNFDDPDAVLRECHRVLTREGTLALTTNVSGHMRELYDVFGALIAERGDPAEAERLAANVAHRGTVEGVTARLGHCGFRVVETHVREVPMRFRSADAVFAHHWVQLGFLDGWEAVVGEAMWPSVRTELGARLDRIAGQRGELRLTIPYLCVVAAPE